MDIFAIMHCVIQEVISSGKSTLESTGKRLFNQLRDDFGGPDAATSDKTMGSDRVEN